MLDNIYILTDTELCNRIAAKIKTVRLKQNMSQAELANKSGVSISTIKRMEDGEVKNFESLIAPWASSTSSSRSSRRNS